jgi:hypothetical protein
MNKEFIPYEQALELKELGLLTYKKDNDFGLLYKGSDIPSILYQQAFRWFRDRHGLYADLFVDDDQTFGFCVSSFAEEGRCRLDKPIKRQFSTYEESELECIKFLIEIVERKPEAYN